MSLTSSQMLIIAAVAALVLLMTTHQKHPNLMESLPPQTVCDQSRDNCAPLIPKHYKKFLEFVPGQHSGGEMVSLTVNQSMDPRGDLDHLAGMPSGHFANANPKLMAAAEFRNTHHKSSCVKPIPKRSLTCYS